MDVPGALIYSGAAQHTYTPGCDGFHQAGQCKAAPAEVTLVPTLTTGEPLRIIPDPAYVASIARKEEALERLRARAESDQDLADLLILLGYR